MIKYLLYLVEIILCILVLTYLPDKLRWWIVFIIALTFYIVFLILKYKKRNKDE